MIRRRSPKVGRNDPCPCGSNKKYKKCHGVPAPLFQSETAAAATVTEWPPVLYKFMERKYAIALVTKGIVQIGTLEGFRRVEEHYDGIGDAGEGTDVLQSGPLWTSAPENTSVPGINLEGEARGSFTLRNVEFRTKIKNALIFCSAAHLAAQGLSRSYDAVVEIFHPREFVDAVTAELRQQFPDLHPLGFAKCVYADRETQLDPGYYLGDYSWTRKPPRFKPQAEYRAAWSTQDLSAAPIKLAIPSICNFVRIRPTDAKGGNAAPASG